MTISTTAEFKKVQTELPKSWVVWACAAFFYCYQFMLRASPGVMSEDLIASFDVDACTLGILTSCYYYAYTSLQIPVGSLMDRFKPRRMLTFATIMCGAGSLIFSTAESIPIAGLGRAMIGAGSAFAFLSCLKLGTVWFPPQRLPFVVGLTLFLGTVGGISAGFPMGWLVDDVGWRHAMWVVAFGGFALAILSWTMVRDKAPPHLEQAILESHDNDLDHTVKLGLIQSILEVTRKPQSWIIALYGFFMYVPLSGFIDQWGPSFFIASYGVSKSTAGAMNSVMLVGIGLGAPLFPFICKYLNAFKPVIFISAFGAALALSTVMYIPGLPIWLVTSLLFLTGFCLGGQFLAFSMTCSLNPLSVSATAGGFHNMLCMMSGVIFQPLIGWLLDYSWSGTYTHGVRAYLPEDYIVALSSVTISLFLACLVVMFINEQYSK